MTAPPGTEFDDTGRLAMGAEFGRLDAAPLRAGGTVDLGLVPGIVGASDLITGAIPAGLSEDNPAGGSLEEGCWLYGPKTRASSFPPG